MHSHTTQDRFLLLKFLDLLRQEGPLATSKRVSEFIQARFDRVPGCRRIILSINRLICIVQHYLDNSFDRKYGTDTSGVIHLKDLTIESKRVKEGIRYEPMSTKVFRQIMNHLNINFGEFKFIDFGSGKGRVLLLASEYGFKKIIGVEFAKELHRIAAKNVTIRERCTRNPNNIETICMDAAEFTIPNGPLVIFFYSPFKGAVMEQVLINVSKSFAMNPREIVLVFYGKNSDSIKLLKATKFQCRELQLPADWSRFRQYRSFLFTRQ